MLVAVVTAAGWLVVSVAPAGSDATQARAAAPAAVPIVASVAADGTAASTVDPRWQAHKLDVGRYELTFTHDVDLAIRSWEHPAGVTVVPRPGMTWLVAFADGDEPVDTLFSFQAAPALP